MTITHVMQPAGVPVLLQLIAEAWQHGRRSPALMDIEWEAQWNNSIETLRARYGFQSIKVRSPPTCWRP